MGDLAGRRGFGVSPPDNPRAKQPASVAVGNKDTPPLPFNPRAKRPASAARGHAFVERACFCAALALRSLRSHVRSVHDLHAGAGDPLRLPRHVRRVVRGHGLGRDPGRGAGRGLHEHRAGVPHVAHVQEAAGDEPHDARAAALEGGVAVQHRRICLEARVLERKGERGAVVVVRVCPLRPRGGRHEHVPAGRETS
jgi:hypothetical protein